VSLWLLLSHSGAASAREGATGELQLHLSLAAANDLQLPAG